MELVLGKATLEIPNYNKIFVKKSLVQVAVDSKHRTKCTQS